MRFGQVLVRAVVFGVVCLGIVFAAILGNGNIVAPVAPVLAIALFAVIWAAPVRRSLYAIVFTGLALDNPADGGINPHWHTPLAPIGGLLSENLNKTVHIEALKFSLLSVLLVLLFVIQRRQLSDAGRVAARPAHSPVITALGAAMLTVMALAVYGLAGHADVQMINLEVQRFVLTALLAYLLAGELRGHRDYATLAGLIIVAACSKAFLALFNWANFEIPKDGGFATNHGDSMLFAFAVATWAALCFIGPRSRRARVMTLLMPFILAAIKVNNRRLAWVEIIAMSITLYCLVPWSRGKRALTRLAIFASPAVLVFILAGWNSGSEIFAPVKMLRSVVDGHSDRSTFDRDVENFNLIMTIGSSPVLGTGLGRPYDEVIKGDDISGSFASYLYVPHNSVLWLLATGGVLGFLGIWSVPTAGMFVAARAFLRPISIDNQIVAFIVMSVFQAYMIQCWGDMAFGDLRSLLLVGPALAVASHLRGAADVPAVAVPAALAPEELCYVPG